MPLETATYISQLVSTNPAATDTTGQGDDHLRLIKSAIQATFPGFTAAALASSQAALDGVVATVNTNGVAVLADAGVNFKTNSTDGFRNPAAGEVDVDCGGVPGLKVTAALVTVPGNAAVSGNATVTGNETITGSSTCTAGYNGPGCIPIGGSIQWWTDTLPTGNGTFAWLNGQAISRTTYAALFALWGTTYGAGDGTTTFNVPDTRDNTLVGKGTMGGTTAAGRITNFVTSTLGNLFGECLHLLGIGEVPAHNHGVTDPGHAHGLQAAASVSVVNGVGTVVSQPPFSAAGPAGQGATSSATTGITINNAGGGGTHNNVQPTIVCNHIVRVL